MLTSLPIGESSADRYSSILTWDQIWSIFMPIPSVRRWLLNCDPPSSEDIDLSFRLQPALFGIEFVEKSDAPRDIFDVAEVYAVQAFSSETGIMFGVHLGLNSAFPALSFVSQFYQSSQFSQANEVISPFVTVRRFVLMFLSKISSFIQIEFCWSASGFLMITTTITPYQPFSLGENTNIPGYHHVNCRLYSPEHTQAIFNSLYSYLPEYNSFIPIPNVPSIMMRFREPFESALKLPALVINFNGESNHAGFRSLWNGFITALSQCKNQGTAHIEVFWHDPLMQRTLHQLCFVYVNYNLRCISNISINGRLGKICDLLGVKTNFNSIDRLLQCENNKNHILSNDERSSGDFSDYKHKVSSLDNIGLDQKCQKKNESCPIYVHGSADHSTQSKDIHEKDISNISLSTLETLLLQELSEPMFTSLFVSEDSKLEEHDACNDNAQWSTSPSGGGFGMKVQSHKSQSKSPSPSLSLIPASTVQHFPNKPGRMAWTCNICSKRIMGRRQNLQRHIRAVHEKLLLFECPVLHCERKFSTKFNMDRHFDARHSRSRYACQLCSRTFRAQKRLDHHLKTVHPSSDSENAASADFRCITCGGCFSTKSALLRHVSSFHQNLDS